MSDLLHQTLKGYTFAEQVSLSNGETVWRALQIATKRDVAIRVITPDVAGQPNFIRSFESDAQRVASLEHPHIIPLYDYWRDPTGAYLVTRWLRRSLHASLQNGRWSMDSAARLLDQIAGALNAAHRAGVLCGAITLENILLDEDDNAYLTDFRVGVIDAVGDPVSVAEDRALVPGSDVYDLGLLLIEVLTGSADGRNDRDAEAALATHQARHPELPSALSVVLETATAQIPAQRYADPLRMAAAFRAALPGAERHTRQQPLPDPLTERELEILGLLKQGLTNGEIAGRLVLSLTTVKWYLRQIFSKLEVHDRNTAVERGERLGLFASGGGDASGSASVFAAGLIPPMAVPPDMPLVSDIANPFKGLRAFQETDTDDFFGRAALTQHLIARLAESGDAARFLAVVGPSGSGKSSVVRAGLIPGLRRGMVPGSDRWFVADMLPGTHPFEELEAAIVRVATHPPENLLRQLREGERGLARVLKRALPPDGTPLVLIIDQFEEVFTLTADEGERREFLDALHSAVTDPRGHLYLIVTLRADFYDRPLLYERFGGLLRTRTEVVLPLSTEELLEAILRPAERVGVAVEPDLLAALTKDVGEQPGTLPLLQYTLTELFEQRSGNRLTLENYRATGGLFSTLARRADWLYERLDPTAQEVARQLLLRLVTLGDEAQAEDTRRRVPIAELVAPTDAQNLLDDLLDTFSAYRLLSFDRDPHNRAPTVEVAHEALIRHWGRLRGWLDDSRGDLRTQRRLLAAAGEWVRSGREVSFLALGAQLAQFEALAAAASVALNADEKEYLAASSAEYLRQQDAERERQAHELTLQRRAANRLRYLVGVLALFLVVALALSGVVLNSREELASSLAYSEAVRLALESEALHDDLDFFNELSALLAVRSVRTTYTLQGDAALVGAAQLNYPVERLQVDGFAYAWALASAPNGSLFATLHATDFNPRTASSEVWLWDLQTLEPSVKLQGDIPSVWAVTWSPDSRYVVGAVGEIMYLGDPMVIHMWDATTGEIYRQFPLGSDRLWETVSVGADGREVYAVVLDPNDRYAIRYWDVETGADLRRVDLPYTGRVEEQRGDPQTRIWLSRPQPNLPQQLAVITFVDAPPELWDIRSGTKIRSLDGSIGYVMQAQFSPTQNLVTVSVATGAFQDTRYAIEVLNATTGDSVRTFGDFSGTGLNPDQVVFSPDERFLWIGSSDNARQASLWDMETGQRVETWDAANAAGAFAGGGEILLMAHSDQAVAEVYALDDPALPQRLPHPERVRGVAYSHDGRWVASAGGDHLIRLWDAHSFEEVRQFVGHVAPATEVRFSPDDRTLLSAGWNDDYRLWDVQTGEQVWQYGEGTVNRFTPAFTSDGRYMLSVNTDENQVKFSMSVVEVGVGTEVARIPLPDGSGVVNCAKFSPDDRYVMITKGADWEQSYLWDWRSGSPAVEIHNETNVSVRCGAFTPDSRQLILAGNDGILRIYDVTSAAEVRRIVGLPQEYMEVVFSPDGAHVLGTGNREVRMWDFATGEEVRRYAFPGAIWGAAFSPDGSRIAFGSYDGDGVYVVHTDLEAQVRALCARLSRDFTDAERAQYAIADTQPTCLSPGA